MSQSRDINKIYQEFCYLEGNQHIASEYAIRKLQLLVKYFEVSNILEIGLGIGSIAGTLLRLNPEISYTGTENNEFCKQALSLNLGHNHKRLRVFSRLEELPLGQKYDLIIVDGKDPKIDIIKQFVSRSSIIVIEGDRIPQQNLLLEFFPDHKYVHCISRTKNKDYSPFPSKNWQGGVKLIFIRPNLKQHFWWAKEKLGTKVKYQLRKSISTVFII